MTRQTQRHVNCHKATLCLNHYCKRHQKKGQLYEKKYKRHIQNYELVL